MRWLKAEPVASSDLVVPFELLLGGCAEIWAPGEFPGSQRAWVVTFRRLSDAFVEFARSVGVPAPGGHLDWHAMPLALKRIRRAPWSFARATPGEIAERLERAGLPSSWRPGGPTPAGSVSWFDHPSASGRSR